MKVFLNPSASSAKVDFAVPDGPMMTRNLHLQQTWYLRKETKQSAPVDVVVRVVLGSPGASLVDVLLIERQVTCLLSWLHVHVGEIGLL